MWRGGAAQIAAVMLTFVAILFAAENMARGAATAQAPPEQTGDGVLFPAYVIALGEVGLKVAQKLRAAVIDHFGSADRVPTMRLLFIDTDPETGTDAALPGVTGPLSLDEVFTARLNRPGHYLKPRRNGRSIIEGWFDPQLLYRIKAGNPLTQGMRALGRLAFQRNERTS